MRQSKQRDGGFLTMIETDSLRQLAVTPPACLKKNIYIVLSSNVCSVQKPLFLPQGCHITEISPQVNKLMITLVLQITTDIVWSSVLALH